MASPCGVVGTSEVVTPPRSRLSPSPGVGRGGDRLLESRWSPSPGVGRGGDHHPEVEVEPEPWGRARQRFLWRSRLDLVAVSLTLAGGTAVRAAKAALFSCQISHWRGEMTAVTSALSTGEHASG
jgi:hypothetical protein